MYNYIYHLFLLFLFFEIILYFLVHFLKSDFQWIVTKKDEFPFKSKFEFNKFFKYSFDKKTGWDRKKNTSGFEILNGRKTYFNITKNGFRNTPLKNKKSLISVFGDSYAFCRYVNDNKTWEAALEKKIRSCVKNFGVGNFGLDQSFLKYKKIKSTKSTKLIIFAFVPETIVRINSYWKHYNEFGNKFGFKPFFKLQGNQLVLKENVLNKNIKIKTLKQKIFKIKKDDFFYKSKFKNYMFKFPYTVSYLRFFRRNTIIFSNMLTFKIFKIFNLKSYKKFYSKSYNKIMRDNIYQANEMYFDKYFSVHLKKMMIEINRSVKNKNKKCIFLILPQYHDIILIKTKTKNYQTFYNKLYSKSQLNILDTTKYFLIEKNLRELYLEDNYGGHLSEKGNEFIARQLYKYIKLNKLL